MKKRELEKAIFKVKADNFDSIALEVFHFQRLNNPVYKEWLSYISPNAAEISRISDIPFLPISFFKSHKVYSYPAPPKIEFTSSGTTGSSSSRHLVGDITIYEQSFFDSFEQFYGPVEEWCILALLPAYLERKGSSLVYMAEYFIKRSKVKQSGFYLNNYSDLSRVLKELEGRNQKCLLLGVSFALLDMAEQFPQILSNTVVMETGGMKGRRKEIIRSELHSILTAAFNCEVIHSEYGMTELLSQAYSKGNGIFNCPNWMRVLPREIQDPLSLGKFGVTAGVNVIDLANLYSCSFLATQDLGKVYEDGSFELLGRFDNSDLRGCNLLLLMD